MPRQKVGIFLVLFDEPIHIAQGFAIHLLQNMQVANERNF